MKIKVFLIKKRMYKQAQADNVYIPGAHESAFCFTQEKKDLYLHAVQYARDESIARYPV